MKNEIRNKILAALIIWVFCVALIYGAAAFVFAEPNSFNWRAQDRLAVALFSAIFFIVVLLGLIHSLEEQKSHDTRIKVK